mmetsp:Transcript_83698/g.148057  ORF Transcript_83698/g.148057 Transcript_83698/m.148057 type:complete len:355 (-) Transcript_83698:86-1150(-)
MWDTKLRDIAPKTPGGLFGTACCSVFGFVMLILFGPSSVLQLDRLHYGLLKDGISGVVDMENVISPGRYYAGFWKEIIHFPSTLNTIEFSDEPPEEGVQHLSVLQARDKDGKQIFVDISIQYRLPKDKVGVLYREMLDHYEEVFTSELRDALSKATNLFAVSEAWESYENVTAILKSACVDALSKRNAECWGLQLWGIRLESRYEAALIRTQVRKQAQRSEEARKAHSVVRAETEALLAEYRKNKTIIESKGEAQRFLIEQEAIANAEKALIDSQAKSLDLVRQSVVLAKTNTGITEDQLVAYQRYITLQQKKDVNFMVNSLGSPLEAVNARAFKDLAASGLAGSTLSQSSVDR